MALFLSSVSTEFDCGSTTTALAAALLWVSKNFCSAECHGGKGLPDVALCVNNTGQRVGVLDDTSKCLFIVLIQAGPRRQKRQTNSSPDPSSWFVLRTFFSCRSRVHRPSSSTESVFELITYSGLKWNLVSFLESHFSSCLLSAILVSL